eukprot:1152332-Pelagomonas_calceolata.AAC.8
MRYHSRVQYKTITAGGKSASFEEMYGQVTWQPNFWALLSFQSETLGTLLFLHVWLTFSQHTGSQATAAQGCCAGMLHSPWQTWLMSHDTTDLLAHLYTDPDAHAQHLSSVPPLSHMHAKQRASSEQSADAEESADVPSTLQCGLNQSRCAPGADLGTECKFEAKSKELKEQRAGWSTTRTEPRQKRCMSLVQMVHLKVPHIHIENQEIWHA